MGGGEGRRLNVGGGGGERRERVSECRRLKWGRMSVGDGGGEG